MQHRAKLSVAPVNLKRHASRSADDDDARSSQSSSCGSEKETRGRPLEPLVEARKDGSVRVAVRIRPPLPWELARNAVTCVKTLRDSANTVQVTAGAHPAKQFTFDHVFSQAVQQTEVYDEVLHPWMESFLQGFNVTVIAYGQTGSGKTYTMGNNMPSACMVANSMFASPPSCDDSTDEEFFDALDNNEGLIPRFLHHLFTKLDEKKRNVELSVSFLEIYGQDIYDLLDSPATQRLGRRPESLQLRENAKNGVWVQGLKEVRVSSRQEALDHMQRGALQRITASTQMNEQSSRSHAVYTVKIVQRVSGQNFNLKKSNKLAVGSSSSNDVATDAIESDAVIVSKLTFVDLAGSERLKKTLAEGDRMKEGIQINAGLFALGNVINALGDDKRRGHSKLHVPYRSSKLTRLLQAALGGNSRTLFIACVSSVDLHANETLNTLVYANRAKNIQNKAVKNINSRSAELANSKAYNQLLCRELVKAVLAEYKRGAHGDIDSLADVCMSNPEVLSYFGSIEQLSASADLMLSSNERTLEVRRLLSSLTSHLCGLASKKGYRRAASLTSGIENEPKRIPRRGEPPDSGGDIGSSMVILEEGNPDADEAFATTCSLGKLCRTLGIMSFAFEMLEIQRGEKELRQSVDAKRTKLETQYRRQEFLRDGLSGMIDRMQTWLSSSTMTQDTRRSIRSSVEAAQGKLASMAIGMEDLKDQITRLSCDQQLALECCQKEWIAKHDQLNEMREAQDKTTTNTLDALIWKTEIELRFDSYGLDSISELLMDEEKELAACIAGGDGTISFTSPLFTKEELALSQHCEIYSMIHDQLRNAFDNEILEAAMNKELRKRTQLIHKIANGATACFRDGMTKNMFMEENERILKDCENSISEIREAMLARRCQRATMAETLDSVGSLDTAKVLIRRLIVQVYSHWRNDMTFDEKEEAKKRKKIEQTITQNLAAMKTDMDAKLDTIEARYEQDLKSAFQMVTSFNDVVRSSGHSLVHDPSGQAEAADKIFRLGDREKMLIAELADSKKEMVAMRLELDQLRTSARSAERKEEAFRVMSRCQDIWQELGVNDEDQASKFQDINGLLLKKCSEELESLEAAREMIQARINDTCRVVSRMESFLRIDTPLRIQSLPVVAGGSLLEQEKYVLLLQKRLSNELWHNLNARVQLSADIRKLSGDLRIESCKDFRHVADDALGHFDTDFSQSIALKFDAWKSIAQNAGAADVLDQFVDSLDEGTDLSRTSIQRGEDIFNIMLFEKMKRIAEVKECATAIRAIARKSQLSQDDVGSVIRRMLDEEDSFDGVIDTKSTILEDLCAHIYQTGGRLDFRKHRLEVLAKVLCSLEEVQAGRSDVLDFLHRIVEEAAMLTHDVALSGHEDDIFCHFTSPLPPIPRGDQSFVDTLAAGKEILCCLSEPVEGALRSLLYSMDNDFAAFGINTKAQRLSFFLGCRIDDNSSQLATLDKYVIHSSDAAKTLSSDGNSDIGFLGRAPECNDSFLSRLDPVFEEFHWTYSVSFGDSQLQRLRTSIADIREVKNAIISAQIRLKSLRKIMVIYNKINEFKSKIAEFEASASQKDRLFGNSLVLLEEERFRKMAAKHYPNLLAALQKEVSRWLENEGGEYDLSVLGEDLKNLLLEMMNTNTDLMHLDLGIVSRASKQMVTPTSSSASLQTTATGSNQRTTSKIVTSSGNNVRNQSSNEHEAFQL